jgi:DNA-binding CsgD family transcriptional regulator
MDALKIVNSTGDPAFAVDRHGIVRAWNNAAENIFGYSATAVEGRPCWEVLCGCDASHNDYCGKSCPLRRMAFSAKSVNSTRIYFRLASNETKPFLMSTLMLYNGPGEQLMAHICRPDITVPESAPGKLGPESADAVRPIRLSNNYQRGGLTQRQLEVLSLLAAGRSTREIASLMCVSLHTVRNHVSQILFKLHVHSRVEAVALGRKLGVI